MTTFWLHACLVAACILGVEVFVRSGFTGRVRRMGETAGKVARLIPEKRISDHWKEKMVPAYAFAIMRASLWMLAVLLSVIAVFLALSLVSDGFLPWLMSVGGILESLAVAVVYVQVRNRMMA
jgi:hypothetical protein